jgi:hypothetical protein
MLFEERRVARSGAVVPSRDWLAERRLVHNGNERGPTEDLDLVSGGGRA